MYHRIGLARIFWGNTKRNLITVGQAFPGARMQTWTRHGSASEPIPFWGADGMAQKNEQVKRTQRNHHPSSRICKMHFLPAVCLVPLIFTFKFFSFSFIIYWFWGWLPDSELKLWFKNGGNCHFLARMAPLGLCSLMWKSQLGTLLVLNFSDALIAWEDFKNYCWRLGPPSGILSLWLRTRAQASVFLKNLPRLF